MIPSRRILQLLRSGGYILVVLGFLILASEESLAQGIFNNFDPSKIPRIMAGLACYFVQFGLIAVGVAVIYTGIIFVLSRGNPDAYSRAKSILFYSILGGIIIYGVFTIIMSIGGLIGITDLWFIPLNCSSILP